MELKVYFVIVWSSLVDFLFILFVNRFIDFCVVSKVYIGVDFVEDDEMVDDIMERFDVINLKGGMFEEEG